MQTAAEEARKEAERIRDERLKQAEQQREALLNQSTDTIDALVENICGIILSTECETDNT